MKYFYKFLTFILTPVSMISGLAAAPIISIFYVSNILYNIKNIDFSLLLRKPIALIMMSWGLLSCIWSPDSVISFKIYLVVLFTYLTLVISLDKAWYSRVDVYKSFGIPLIASIIVAIIFFFIEYRTEGFITKSFREVFSSKSNIDFYLHLLDRGCSVLSVLIWPALFLLFRRQRYLLAILLLLICGYIFNLSDSLSTYLAFLISILTFVVTYYTRLLFNYLIITGFILSLFLVPLFATISNAEKINETYQTIPDSGKHRLFIYNFVGAKALEKPFFGWGFGSSSIIPVDEDNDMIYYNQYKWHPLPLHPHNNILQIWLETGIIGLILFGLIVVKLLNKIYIIARTSEDYLWGAISITATVNYLIIGAISYGVWQEWWILIGSYTILLLFLFSNFKKIKKYKELEIRG